MTNKARELLEAALDHLHGMNSYEDCLLKNRIRAYLAEPKVPFVRLTEEELKECWGFPYSLSTDELRRFARAIEDALEEKNK